MPAPTPASPAESRDQGYCVSRHHAPKVPQLVLDVLAHNLQARQGAANSSSRRRRRERGITCNQSSFSTNCASGTQPDMRSPGLREGIRSPTRGGESPACFAPLSQSPACSPRSSEWTLHCPTPPGQTSPCDPSVAAAPFRSWEPCRAAFFSARRAGRPPGRVRGRARKFAPAEPCKQNGHPCSNGSGCLQITLCARGVKTPPQTRPSTNATTAAPIHRINPAEGEWLSFWFISWLTPGEGRAPVSVGPHSLAEAVSRQDRDRLSRTPSSLKATPVRRTPLDLAQLLRAQEVQAPQEVLRW